MLVGCLRQSNRCYVMFALIMSLTIAGMLTANAAEILAERGCEHLIP